MTKILVTGFMPFDGRKMNASWIAAQSIVGSDIKAVEIPVEWGKPREILASSLNHFEADLIISFGEGHVGEFNIETKARNTRKQRADNTGALPSPSNFPDGEEEILASIDARDLQERILSSTKLSSTKEAIPLKLSADAGAFICEETLYTLERMKSQIPKLRAVVFIHLPPFATPLNYLGKDTICDESLLADFAKRAVDAILAQDNHSFVK